jgi:hypothetical protein
MNALAFNRNRCCHLVLCLRLIPFHFTKLWTTTVGYEVSLFSFKTNKIVNVMDKNMKDSNHSNGQWVHYIRIFKAKLSKKARAFVIV